MDPFIYLSEITIIGADEWRPLTVSGAEVVSNARNSNLSFNTRHCVFSRRRLRAVGKDLDQYSITIQPKVSRSSSLSDLTSEFNIDYSKFCLQKKRRKSKFSFYECSGDTLEKYINDLTEHPYNSSWIYKDTNKYKDMSSYGPKFAKEFICNMPDQDVENTCSSLENSSSCSTARLSVQKGATFPFKSTPSGNLKVQSNQVVFQSSTVGVLLADPTQAKVKVKFEGKAAGEPDDESSQNFDNTEGEPQLQYGPRTVLGYQCKNSDRPRGKSQSVREDKGKDLSSLGYAVAEPIDWIRVQLPKKQDLFQEFFKRIHNHVNTDTIVRIGEQEFCCHRLVLQIYSSYFDLHPTREIEIPAENVTPAAFQMIYEWMIFNGQESNKTLKRDNVLDLFCAAQYLSIKDLEKQCWSLITNDNIFTEDTAFGLFREARIKGLTPVMDIMVPRIMRFFLPLVASKDFLSLDPQEILTFLNSNYISVTSEIEVLMAGVRWLYGDWSNRRQYAVNVMRCVRFGLISPWQLVDIKRNPDNNEVLEVVNVPEVQQMVDDGLAYVIIKYWYGNNSKNYYHWIDVLGLTEPAERNWIGEEKNHVTYKDFLKYLEQFMVPREQMYQQMSMMQTARRGDLMPGNVRRLDTDNLEMRRPKIDFPLPATLKRLAGDKERSFPTMSEFFENRRKAPECNHSKSPTRSPPTEPDTKLSVDERRRSPVQSEVNQTQYEDQKRQLEPKSQEQSYQRRQIQQIHTCAVELPDTQTSIAASSSVVSPTSGAQCAQCAPEASSIPDMFDPPEKDSEEMNTTSDSSSCTVDTSDKINMNSYMHGNASDKRHSVAASYLAAATAALASTRRTTHQSPSRSQHVTTPACNSTRQEPSRTTGEMSSFFSPQISLFNHSKESLSRINLNKLSTSILGPSNKNYISEGSLFNWDRETVLVFGGIDPHTSYGIGSNTGKDIFRFDPVTNEWENVGELPEPRHHHSVAFLRGRVYLVGGADPRDDDIRGKSVVVSTVWSYEPVTRSWFSESGLAVPRKNFGLVVHRMALYAIGGQDKKGRVLRSVERFDPKTASWSEVRPMGVARMAVAVTKYREYIWVAGGMTGEKKKPVCKIVECYNSNTNDWTEIHSLRFPRCFATLFSMNDHLYIIGGAGKVSDKDKTASSVGAIDVWNWQTRKWQQQTEMSMPRHGHALAYLGTQLIIIGGVTTIYMRALNNVESYCCERNAWIRGVSALPSPLSGHGAVTLPPASLM